MPPGLTRSVNVVLLASLSLESLGQSSCSRSCRSYVGGASAQSSNVCLNEQNGKCGAADSAACTYTYCQQTSGSDDGTDPSPGRSSCSDGMICEIDIVYKELSGSPIKLDIYKPPQTLSAPAAGWPIVMQIHGGAWLSGSKGLVDSELKSRVIKGDFAVVSINYRLAKEGSVFPGHSVTAPAQIEDVIDAARFFQNSDGTSTAKSTQYGLNGASMGCKGCSAGGHLCALLATFGTSQCGVHLKAALDVSGPTSILEMQSDASSCEWVGGVEHFAQKIYRGATGILGRTFPGDIVENVEIDPTTEIATAKAGAGAPYPCLAHIANLYNPLRWVDALATPPTYILHPSNDETVSCGQGKEFYDRLQAKAVRSERPAIGGGHCNGYESSEDAPAYDWLSNYVNGQDMGGYYASSGQSWTTTAQGFEGECLASIKASFTTCDTAGDDGWLNNDTFVSKTSAAGRGTSGMACLLASTVVAIGAPHMVP